MFDVKDKVVVVTGSSRGIGRAISVQLARSGAKVVISSRKEEACEAVYDELVKEGHEVLCLPCHVGEREQVENLIKKTVEKWGRIDSLICNAATNPVFGPISTLTDKAFDKIMNINLKSSLWLSNLSVPHMVKNGGGSIILMSSITAFVGTDTIGAYGISKAAEASLVRNLAVELGPKGIRVNGIAPGLIKTDFSRALWENPKLLEKQENQTPLRRIGKPEDIAGIAHFLVCDASSYIAGQLIVADGGETISWG